MQDDLRDLRALCRALEGAVPCSADWQSLLALANRTLVTPALASALHGKPGVPEDVEAFLAHIAGRTAQRNDLMKQQLIEAVHTLASRGLTPILIKGAAFLASQPTVCVNRLSTDLDLVLPLDAAPCATEILQSIGYQPQSATTARGAGLSLERQSDVGEIDLHLRLRSFEMWPAFDQLVPFCTRVDLAGTPIFMPSPSLQAAMFVAHDQLQERDYWRGLIDLRHFVDLRSIVANSGPLDLQTLSVFFPSKQAWRALATQLETLSRLFPGCGPCELEPSRWARIQCNRRFLQVGRDHIRLLLTAGMLLLDPPSVTRPLRPLEARRERAQYFKRLFSDKKATKV